MPEVAPIVLSPQTVVCPILVGRDGPLAAARAALERARSGAGGILLIAGEAGVGKSRLLRSMQAEARAGGFVVLQGACFEAERAEPFAALADLVRSFAASTSPAVAAHALGGAAPELLVLFPELATVFPEATAGSAVDPEQDRRRLFHALSTTFQQLARVQPLLLVFEDVHWSDDATLDLILHLTRGIAAQPCVVALSYRSDEVGPRLARLLAELDRTRLVTEIDLGPLATDDVARMLHAIFGETGGLGEPFVHSLHAVTEGNPFFVEEVLKGLITAGELERADDGAWRARPLERVRVPRTAVEAVRRRLARLGPPARELASVAAVAGRRFDFGLLQAVTGLAEAELLCRVRELIDAQVVVEEDAERIAFRHALTREAIYAELLARERVALHRAVAAALESRRGSDAAQVEVLAYHTFEAGEWERARAYATQAAEHALALYAPREALAHLERALSAGERQGVAPDPALLAARGRARETLGDFEGAHADFTALLDMARAEGNGQLEWQALYALGMLWSARDYARAGEYRAQALALARDLGDASMLARSLNRVGNWHLNLEQPGPALRLHRQALELFENLGDERGVAETVDLIAMVHYIAGNLVEAMASYERVVSLFTALGDRRGIARGLALVALSGPSVPSSATVVGSSSMIREVLARERAVRLAAEIGWRAGEAFCTWLLADCFTWRGRYERALPLAREALGIAQEIEHLEWQCGAERSLGFIALDLLDPVTAHRNLARAHAIALRLGSRTWIRWTAAPLAVAQARLGDHAGARALLHAAGEPARLGRDALLPDDEEVPTIAQRQLTLAGAELALAEGDPGKALRILDRQLADERRRAPAADAMLPRLALLRALALIDLGGFTDAVPALEAALTQAEAQEARPLVWRGQAALGRAHQRLGHRLEARGAFDAAREIAADLEARVPDEQLRQAFARGVSALVPPAKRPSLRQATREAYGGLTRREREVAQLVAAGRSNRGIARALGIGERTAEDHVAHALAKLGFSSRAQLAAWCVQMGMVQSPTPG